MDSCLGEQGSQGLPLGPAEVLGSKAYESSACNLGHGSGLERKSFE